MPRIIIIFGLLAWGAIAYFNEWYNIAYFIAGYTSLKISYLIVKHFFNNLKDWKEAREEARKRGLTMWQFIRYSSKSNTND